MPRTVLVSSSTLRPSLRIGMSRNATSATKATAARRPAISPTDIRLTFPSGDGIWSNQGRRLTLSRLIAAHDRSELGVPFGVLAFGPSIAGLVIPPLEDHVWGVLLFDHASWVVVGVRIPHAVVDRLRSGVMRVAQMWRN